MIKWFEKLFYPTHMSQGMRHGRNGLPHDRGGGEFWISSEATASLAQILRQLQVRKEGSELPAPDANQLIEARNALQVALQERGIFDNVDKDRLNGLVELLTDIQEMTTSNSSEENLRNIELSFWEATYIKLCERDIDKIHESWEGTRHDIESRVKRLHDELADIRQEHERYRKRHEEKQWEMPSVMMNKWTYACVLLLVGGSELAFNAQAFEILDLEFKETYMIALAPSVSFPLLAHIIGVKMRQGLLQGEKRWRSIAVLGLSLACVVVGLLSIVHLRSAHLVSKGVAVNSGASLALLGINFLFLGFAMAASYMSHDHDRDLEEIVAGKMKYKKLMGKVWKQWAALASKADQLRAVARDKVDAIRDNACASLYEYRLGVATTAPAEQVPESFKTPVTNLLFRPRDFSYEIDPPPPPLEDLVPWENEHQETPNHEEPAEEEVSRSDPEQHEVTVLVPEVSGKVEKPKDPEEN